MPNSFVGNIRILANNMTAVNTNFGLKALSLVSMISVGTDDMRMCSAMLHIQHCRSHMYMCATNQGDLLLVGHNVSLYAYCAENTTRRWRFAKHHVHLDDSYTTVLKVYETLVYIELLPAKP